MELRMSEPEKVLYLSFLQCARNYVEFGAGGSTLAASQLVSGHVWSVDSSKEWLDRIAHNEKFVAAKTTLLEIDIGPVGNWGWPNDKIHAELFPKYSRSVWSSCSHDAVDLILIDGRFRVACFAEAIKRAPPTTAIFFHDYPQRVQYHIVEKIARKVAVVDSLALFQPIGVNFDVVDGLSETFKFDPN